MMFGVFALWIPFYLVNSGRRKEGRDRLRVQGQEIIALPVEAVVIAFSLGAPLTSLPPHPADQVKHIPSFHFPLLWQSCGGFTQAGSGCWLEIFSIFSAAKQ